MLPVRIAFDPALPIVASQAFTIGEQSFKDGDSLPWRELGIDERTLRSFWTSGLVRCLPAPPVAAPPAAKSKQAARR